jgi:cytochrome b subunit of formate dehydrogenase
MASSVSNIPEDIGPAPPVRARVIYRHSLVVRVTHWINALCFALLLMSGLQIFNAHPLSTSHCWRWARGRRATIPSKA